MKPIKFLLILTTLLLPLVAVEAREWSGEIRMTHWDSLRCGSPMYSAQDSNGDLHILVQSYGPTGAWIPRPCYQKFTKFGEPLTEPLLLDSIVAIPKETNAYGYDIFCDAFDEVYLLWGDHCGDRQLHCTRLDVEGKVLNADIHLRDFTVYNSRPPTTDPQLVVNDEGEILIFTVGMDFAYADYWNYYALGCFRFRINGAFQDTVQVFGVGRSAEAYYQYFQQFRDGNLNFLWSAPDVPPARITYVRLSQELLEVNRLIIKYGDTLIDRVYKGASPRDFDITLTGLPVFLISAGGERSAYLLGVDEQMNPCFTANVGQAISSDRSSSMVIDVSGQIHVIQATADPTINNGHTCITYLELDAVGVVMDSTDIISQSRTAYDITSIIASDGAISAIWMDSRFSADGAIMELVMNYSLPENGVDLPKTNSTPVTSDILTAYPNPFNSTTTYSFKANLPGNYQLTIYDLAGQSLFSQSYPVTIPSRVTDVWTGCNQAGSPAASGTYIIELRRENLVLGRRTLMLTK